MLVVAVRIYLVGIQDDALMGEYDFEDSSVL
jgi:hypothetical protein